MSWICRSPHFFELLSWIWKFYLFELKSQSKDKYGCQNKLYGWSLLAANRFFFFFFACVRMSGVLRPKCGALTDISPASSSWTTTLFQAHCKNVCITTQVENVEKLLILVGEIVRNTKLDSETWEVKIEWYIIH